MPNPAAPSAPAAAAPAAARKAPHPEDRPSLAAALILLGVGVLSLQDSLVKLISDSVSLWQFQCLRAGGNLLLLLALGRLLYGGSPWRPVRLWAVALRSACLTVTMVLFFGAAPFLTLAEMGAGLYTYPLFIAIAAALFLGERVGPRRIAAIVAGFAGALLILRPGAEQDQRGREARPVFGMG
ncbi:MAG: EamA family transporter, partial [Pseudomonadota bacterium]